MPAWVEASKRDNDCQECLTNVAWRWRVDYRIGRQRERRSFKSEEEANKFKREASADLRSIGYTLANLSPSDRIAIAHSLNRLATARATLHQAVDFFLAHSRKAPAPMLRTLADEMLEAKRLSGKRPRYLQQIRHSLNAFITGRGERTIDMITPAEIQTWLTSNGWKPATMRSYLIDVRTLFGFALKREYCARNPATSVEMPMLEDRPPGILTVEQCRKGSERGRSWLERGRSWLLSNRRIIQKPGPTPCCDRATRGQSQHHGAAGFKALKKAL